MPSIQKRRDYLMRSLPSLIGIYVLSIKQMGIKCKTAPIEAVIEGLYLSVANGKPSKCV